MERTRLESRAVRSAGYDDATQTLEIEFSSGRVYEFYEVPKPVYEWLLRTPSKGGYIARMINPKYRYRDVTQVAADGCDDLVQQLRKSVQALEDER